MHKKTSARNLVLDIVRCFAFVFVVSVHFFLNTEYYAQLVDGRRMFIMTLMRSFFMICVPLFMILSGYFMCHKTVSKSHYGKLPKTLVTYLLASVACMIYKIIALHYNYAPVEVIRGFFAFEHANYSWYVEMYIGVFLLCPFLNLVYNHLTAQRQKQILVGTMLFLTAAPSLLNIFIPDLQWFLQPGSNGLYFPVVPDYWIALYPITYYFIGCYLREYPIKLKARWLFLLNVIVFLINGSFSFYRSYGTVFVWGLWQDYSGIGQVIQSILFFSFFANLKYDKVPKPAANLISKISELTLGAYLVSYIFDNWVYTILNTAVPYALWRINWFPVLVPLICGCSLLLSFVFHCVYKAGAWAFAVVRNRIKPPCVLPEQPAQPVACDAAEETVSSEENGREFSEVSK